MIKRLVAFSRVCWPASKHGGRDGGGPSVDPPPPCRARVASAPRVERVVTETWRTPDPVGTTTSQGAATRRGCSRICRTSAPPCGGGGERVQHGPTGAHSGTQGPKWALLGRPAAQHVRAGLLPSDQPPTATAAGRTDRPLNPGRFKATLDTQLARRLDHPRHRCHRWDLDRGRGRRLHTLR